VENFGLMPGKFSFGLMGGEFWFNAWEIKAGHIYSFNFVYSFFFIADQQMQILQLSRCKFKDTVPMV